MLLLKAISLLAVAALVNAPDGGCEKSYYSHNGQPKAYISRPRLIAVPMVHDRERTLRFADSLGLVDVSTRYIDNEGIVNLGNTILLARRDGGAFHRFDSRELRVLRVNGIRSGPICDYTSSTLSIFTTEALVHCRLKQVPIDSIHKVLQQHGVVAWRVAVASPELYYQIEFEPGIGEGINDRLRALEATGVVDELTAMLGGGYPSPLD